MCFYNLYYIIIVDPNFGSVKLYTELDTVPLFMYVCANFCEYTTVFLKRVPHSKLAPGIGY